MLNMKISNYTNNKITLILILFLFIIHLIISFKYQLKFQHDVGIYHYDLFALITFNFSEITSAYSILYYLYVASFSVLTYPLFYFELLEPRQIFYLTIRISNIFLFLLTFFLSLRLSKNLFNKKNLNYLLPVLIIFAFSPIQRTFLMMRPENIMIPLSLYLVILINKFYHKELLNLKNKFFLIISSGILIAQKVTGLILFLYINFFNIILRPVFFKKTIKIIILSTVVAIIFIIIHFLITETHPLTRPMNIDSSFSKFLNINIYQLKIFFKFSLIEALSNPLRDYHKDSMINILFLDLFGDYWGYGPKNDLGPEQMNMCLIRINRISFLLSIYYFAIVSISIFIFLKNKLYKKNYLLTLLLLIFLSGFSILILGGLYEYHPETGNIFKWEYITFYFIFSSFFVANYLNNLRKNLMRQIINITFFVFLFFSYLQFMPFRCSLTF